MTRAMASDEAVYGCGYNYKRGTTFCANSVQVRQVVLDQSLLQTIHELLDERVLERALELAIAQLREGREEHVDRASPNRARACRRRYAGAPPR